MKKFFGHPLILSLIIIVGLIFLARQGWLKTPQNIFFRLIAPVQKTLYQFSLKTNNFIDFLVSIKELNQENIGLKEENRELLAEIVQFKGVVQQNEFLRKQMGLPIPEGKQLILANIIGQEPSNLGKYFLINQGEKHGIKEKAAVITAGNILVGQVVEVFNSFSKIRLIIDSNSRINALIQESAVTGLVKGESGLNLLIDLLPQGQTIEKGETVVTSGLAGIFPVGLLIGQIQQVISSDVQISKKAKIKPAADFESLDKVFVFY